MAGEGSVCRGQWRESHVVKPELQCGINVPKHKNPSTAVKEREILKSHKRGGKMWKFEKGSRFFLTINVLKKREEKQTKSVKVNRGHLPVMPTPSSVKFNSKQQQKKVPGCSRQGRLEPW